MRVLLAITLLTATASAQWQLQQSHTTASLRGIHALGNGVAWASGTGGTVLRTLDDGATWQPCAIPPAAEHLDFRGIQAFDTKTAIVMSSGKGDLSRLYKTTDACQTWNLVFTNPDNEGFWDAIKFSQNKHDSSVPCFGEVVGDPVGKHFAIFLSTNCGNDWERQSLESPEALPGESLFAASNSSLDVRGPMEQTFVTGGGASREIRFFQNHGDNPSSTGQNRLKTRQNEDRITSVWHTWPIDLRSSTIPGDSSGAFSISRKGDGTSQSVIVGGDYKKPDQTTGTAWVSPGFEMKWIPAQIPAHGYRSAVAYSPTHKAWITVGPNGTDLSTDDGRTWRPLHPSAPNAEPEEDQHWNALSLPFVVGPKGRIGKLREDAIPH